MAISDSERRFLSVNIETSQHHTMRSFRCCHPKSMAGITTPYHAYPSVLPSEKRGWHHQRFYRGVKRERSLHTNIRIKQDSIKICSA